LDLAATFPPKLDPHPFQGCGFFVSFERIYHMTVIKIGLISDLHAEFWSPLHFDNVGVKVQEQLADADLILLAGDIDNARYSVRTARRLFPDHPVCLVAGNHEFYQQDHDSTLLAIREEAANTNVFFLDRDCYAASISGRYVRVLGVTLWTDFALFGDPTLNMLEAKKGLNDFRLIRYKDRVLTPSDTVVWHEADMAWLLSELDKPFDGVTIVMTHHAPVNFAIAARFVNDRLSPCFASNLENVFARDDVDLVVWGHTHHSVDQTIGKTRFVSNQTGYVTGKAFVETGDFGTVIVLSD
jgi:predicted phosphodiesterase